MKLWQTDQETNQRTDLRGHREDISFPKVVNQKDTGACKGFPNRFGANKNSTLRPRNFCLAQHLFGVALRITCGAKEIWVRRSGNLGRHKLINITQRTRESSENPPFSKAVNLIRRYSAKKEGERCVALKVGENRLHKYGRISVSSTFFPHSVPPFPLFITYQIGAWNSNFTSFRKLGQTDRWTRGVVWWNKRYRLKCFLMHPFDQ